MTTRLNRLLTAAGLLFFGGSALAQQQQHAINLQTDLSVSAGQLIRSAATAPVNARLLHITHTLTLQVDPDWGKKNGRTLTAVIYLQIDGGNAQVASPPEKRRLKVSYTTAGKYRDRDALIKADMTSVSYTIDSVVLSDAAGQRLAVGADNQSFASLKQETQYTLFQQPVPADTIMVQQITSGSSGFADLNWAAVPWAGGYDIEYDFISNYNGDPGGSLSAAALSYDFRHSSTRIRCDTDHYELPLVYEQGFIIFRVRPVALWGDQLDQLVTGGWSVPAQANSLTGAKVGAAGAFFYPVAGAAVHEQDRKSWQFVSDLSEHAQHRDLVTYADGSGRVRQEITAATGQTDLLVGETIYDNSGRAAIGVLPAPANVPVYPAPHLAEMKYQVLFNRNVSQQAYSWQDFDRDQSGGTCDPFPSPMSDTSGAANYYSAFNPAAVLNGTPEQRRMAFLPAAGGYPFKQTAFMPDGTGRVRSLSVPGSAQRTGSGHESRYYYGTPAQDELNRYLGSDAGLARYYSKEVIADANGQDHVFYKDQAGHTVVSALTGLSPATLDAVDVAADRKHLTVNLIDQGNHLDENAKAIVSDHSLIVTEKTQLDISYQLQQTGLRDTLCNSSMKLCYDCVYDLKILVRNTCGDTLWNVNKTIGTLGALRDCEQDTIRSPEAQSLQLDIGTYTVSKVLAVNNAAMETYVTDFLNDHCWQDLRLPAPPVDCSVNASLLKDTVMNQTCISDERTGIRLPAISHLPMLQPCPGCVLTAGKGYIAVRLQQMLADLCPGGQYAEYDGRVGDHPLSVWNETNELPSHGNWKYPVTPYRKEDGSQVLIDSVVHGQHVQFKPEQLPFARFLQYWRPSMAYSLLPYHPEYCQYEWCAAHPLYFNYRDALEATTGFSDAQHLFPELTVTDAHLPDQGDPLFSAAHLPDLNSLAHMQRYLDNIKLLDPAGTGVTVSAGSLAEVAAAGFSILKIPLQVTRYLANHHLFQDPDTREDEWRQFKNVYLMARDAVLDSLRQTADSCCIAVTQIGQSNCGPATPLCPLYSKKLPVFGTRTQILQLIENVFNYNGTPPACAGCTQPQTFVDFLNTLLVNHTLFQPQILNGTLLAEIANATTDEILAGGGKIRYQPVQNGSRIDADLLNSSDGSVAGKLSLAPPAADFDWAKVTAFTCLKKAAVSGGFTLAANDGSGNLTTIPGTVNLFDIVTCPPQGTPAPSAQPAEYTAGVIQMVRQLLVHTVGSQIPAQTVYGRVPRADLRVDPASSWQTAGGTISALTVLPVAIRQHGSTVMTFKLTLSGDAGVMSRFGNWRIDRTDLVMVPAPAGVCASVRQVELTLSTIYPPFGTTKITVGVDRFELGKVCWNSLTDVMCCLPLIPTVEVKGLSCRDIAAIAQENNEEIRIDLLRHRRADSLRAAYIAHCLRPVEQFTLNYDQRTYAATVYHYDQAGNLIRTIMPSVPAQATVMNYNSLNNIVSEDSPDKGLTRYTYDEFARKIYTQTAVQRTAPLRASFTHYDALNRIDRSGEIPLTTTHLATQMSYGQFERQLTDRRGKETDLFTTYYNEFPADNDLMTFDLPLAGAQQQNLRGRVAAMVYQQAVTDSLTYDHALFYSYDIAGNITALHQDLRSLNNYASKIAMSGRNVFHRQKSVYYTYDLISKKITAVSYQPGAADEFAHLYHYDGNGRLTTVMTSRYFWAPLTLADTDARYAYYAHGPLARLSLGQERVQGLDMAYTMEGWIKGVNSPFLTSSADIGKDGGQAPADAFAYALGYYPGDYQPAGGQLFLPETSHTLLSAAPGAYGAAMYNGVPVHQLTALAGADMLAGTFRYDAMGQLKGMQVFEPSDSRAAVWSGGAMTEKYRSQQTYDLNGNIQSLIRNDGAGSRTDDLRYTYYTGTDRLQSVADASGRQPGATDLDRDNAYTYDASGRLQTETEMPVANLALHYDWTAFSKPRLIREHLINEDLGYNAFGTRALKYDSKAKTLTYDVRDLQGNPLAVYQFTPQGAELSQLPLYGSGRLGLLAPGTDMNAPFISDEFVSYRGTKYYELRDHLDNVLAAVSDRRLFQNSKWSAEVLLTQVTDPFGNRLAGRGRPAGYPYGFNGKENDDEIAGPGNHVDFGARFYEPRTGRWLSPDPLSAQLPETSPYVFAMNSPLSSKDPDGKVVLFVNGIHGGDGGTAAYWRSENSPAATGFDARAMDRLGDHNARYIDGALGGWSNIKDNARTGSAFGIAGAVATVLTQSNVNAQVRINAGEAQGFKDAESIISNLSDGETIKIITHSMGTAFARGYVKGIMNYAKINGQDKEIARKFEYELDVNPFEGGSLPADPLIARSETSVGGQDGGGFNLWHQSLSNSVPTVAAVPGAMVVTQPGDKDKGHRIGDMSPDSAGQLTKPDGVCDCRPPVQQGSNNVKAPATDKNKRGPL